MCSLQEFYHNMLLESEANVIFFKAFPFIDDDFKKETIQKFFLEKYKTDTILTFYFQDMILKITKDIEFNITVRTLALNLEQHLDDSDPS